ncbi:MAG: hypothetical protein KJ646_00260 [Nanoarchaeota archaeon]|nr:hypothetical protein [Nanoarchaeota archaeon]
MKSKMEEKLLEDMRLAFPTHRGEKEMIIERINAKVALRGLPKELMELIDSDFRIIQTRFKEYSPGERALYEKSGETHIKFECNQFDRISLPDECTDIIINKFYGSPNLILGLSFDYKSRRMDVAYFKKEYLVGKQNEDV